MFIRGVERVPLQNATRNAHKSLHLATVARHKKGHLEIYDLRGKPNLVVGISSQVLFVFGEVLAWYSKA